MRLACLGHQWVWIVMKQTCIHDFPTAPSPTTTTLIDCIVLSSHWIYSHVRSQNHERAWIPTWEAKTRSNSDSAMTPSILFLVAQFVVFALGQAECDASTPCNDTAFYCQFLDGTCGCTDFLLRFLFSCFRPWPLYRSSSHVQQDVGTGVWLRRQDVRQFVHGCRKQR